MYIYIYIYICLCVCVFVYAVYIRVSVRACVLRGFSVRDCVYFSQCIYTDFWA